MELRSYNVIRIYKDTVKCRIGDKLCVDKEKLEKNAPYIRELLSQVKTYNGEAHFCACNQRTDGEYWTPYLQIVEMLINLGIEIGCVSYIGKLENETIITFKNL